jgi:AcrR family transcriptional regulator
MITLSTSPRPAPYHHGDLRRALIEAGLALLAEQGPEQLSLRAVARRVGVSAMAPYRHFEDREALLAALAEQGFARLADSMRDALAPGPPDRLVALGEAYVRFALAHPALFRLMFAAAIPAGRQEGLRQAGAAAFAALQAETAGRPDRFRSPMAPWCLVHGLAMLLLDGRTGVALDDAAAVTALIRDVLS